MKIILTLLGIALLLFGLLTIFLPLPTGVLSVLAGVALLAAISPTFRRFFKWLRRKVPPLNKAVNSVEDHLPERISKPLHETDPDEDDEETDDDAKTARARPTLPRAQAAYRGYRPSPPPRRR